MPARALAFLRANWVWFAIGIALSVALVLSYCAGGKGEQNKQLKREVKVQKDIGNANTNASTARVEDAARTATEERELDAAIKAVASPDERRALRGCVILRQQGRDVSQIPACAPK
jgi:hypothetical protein